MCGGVRQIFSLLCGIVVWYGMFVWPGLFDVADSS